jgi:CspA family cold shock protein
VNDLWKAIWIGSFSLEGYDSFWKRIRAAEVHWPGAQRRLAESLGILRVVPCGSACNAMSQRPDKRRRATMKEQGVVKWFNGAKGFGFIQRSSGEDVFVHFSAIQESGYKTLNEGEAVEFVCQQGPKGLNAADVTRVA